MNFDVDEMDEQLALDNINNKKKGHHEHRVRKNNTRSRRRGRPEVREECYWGQFRVRSKGGGASLFQHRRVRNSQSSQRSKSRRHFSNT